MVTSAISAKGSWRRVWPNTRDGRQELTRFLLDLLVKTWYLTWIHRHERPGSTLRGWEIEPMWLRPPRAGRASLPNDVRNRTVLHLVPDAQSQGLKGRTGHSKKSRNEGRTHDLIDNKGSIFGTHDVYESKEVT